MRGARDAAEYVASEKLLDDLGAIVLGQKNETFDVAVNLGRIYARNKIEIKQISLADLMQAAYLIVYGTNLNIITTDLRDFPALVFVCEKLFSIEVSGSIEVVGRFQANIERYESHLALLNR